MVYAEEQVIVDKFPGDESVASGSGSDSGFVQPQIDNSSSDDDDHADTAPDDLARELANQNAQGVPLKRSNDSRHDHPAPPRPRKISSDPSPLQPIPPPSPSSEVQPRQPSPLLHPAPPISAAVGPSSPAVLPAKRTRRRRAELPPDTRGKADELKRRRKGVQEMMNATAHLGIPGLGPLLEKAKLTQSASYTSGSISCFFREGSS